MTDRYYKIQLINNIIKTSESDFSGAPIYSQEIYNKFKNLEQSIYWTYVYAGMGCLIYAINNPDKSLTCFFLHSDSMGQYGDDDRPIADELIRDRIFI